METQRHFEDFLHEIESSLSTNNMDALRASVRSMREHDCLDFLDIFFLISLDKNDTPVMFDILIDECPQLLFSQDKDDNTIVHHLCAKLAFLVEHAWVTQDFLTTQIKRSSMVKLWLKTLEKLRAHRVHLHSCNAQLVTPLYLVCSFPILNPIAVFLCQHARHATPWKFQDDEGTQIIARTIQAHNFDLVEFFLERGARLEDKCHQNVSVAVAILFQLPNMLFMLAQKLHIDLGALDEDAQATILIYLAKNNITLTFIQALGAGIKMPQSHIVELYLLAFNNETRIEFLILLNTFGQLVLPTETNVIYMRLYEQIQALYDQVVEQDLSRRTILASLL